MSIDGAESATWAPVVRVGSAAVALAAMMTAAMVLFERVGPEFISEPSSWQSEATVGVAMLSILLLAADVVLPIPASIVLVANGAIFGVAIGSAVSALGLMAGSIAGYWLGRRGRGLATRVVGTDGVRRLQAGTMQHGFWVVGATRAVPLASEITALLSGATRMPVVRFAVAAGVGACLASVALALVGAGAIGTGSGMVVAVAGVGAGAALWFVGRLLVESGGPVQPDLGSALQAGSTSHGF